MNRISFGIQSFDDGTPAAPRPHPRQRARPSAAVKLAQDAGFDNFNLDLMYALPAQTLAMAEHDIERAVALQPAHISHYQLTLEPNTVFAARPPPDLPDEDAAWDMQERCQALLADGRLRAVRGQRLRARRPAVRAQPQLLALRRLPRHRRRRARQAHARARNRRSCGAGSVKHPTAYLAAAGTRQPRSAATNASTPARRPFEYMLNALRLNDGFALAEFEARTGLRARGRSRRRSPKPRRAAGCASMATESVPTELGRRFGNDVIALFLDR